MDLQRWRRVQDGSLLMRLAAAAALASLGGRFGRRAALRGSLASALAGAAALLARAGGLSVPGGTAGAAAFVAGASMELPALALPLSGVAGWPAAFAVGRHHHHPASVVAVSGAGAALALVTKRLWPLAPHKAADLSTTQLGQEPSPDGRGLTLVVNDTAGSALSGSPADELRRRLPEADVIEIDEGEDLAAALELAAASSIALGIAGGDGSINAAAEVAAAAGKPLVIIPAGTLNHLARDLGLISLTDAVTAVRRGQTVAIDLSSIDGRAFLNTASFGSYVDLVDARERLESTIGKWPAVLVALWRVLGASAPVDVELDGRHRQVWMAFIGNCRYQPKGFSPSWRPRLDDGQLDIRIVDGSAPWSRLRLVVALLTGTLGRCRAYEQWTATELHVRSLRGPLRLARDGETFDGAERFSVTKCREPLAVYVPYR